MINTGEQAKVYQATIQKEKNGSVAYMEKKDLEAHVEDWEGAKELFDEYLESVLGWEGFTIQEVEKVDEIDPKQLHRRQLHDCEDGSIVLEQEFH